MEFHRWASCPKRTAVATRNKMGPGRNRQGPLCSETASESRSAVILKLRSKPASSLISFFSQLHELLHEPGVFLRLRVQEESVLSEADDRGHRTAELYRRRADNGYRAKLLVQKVRRLRHDQVRLQGV